MAKKHKKNADFSHFCAIAYDFRQQEKALFAERKYNNVIVCTVHDFVLNQRYLYRLY